MTAYKKVMVSDLKGAALDWAVAQVTGECVRHFEQSDGSFVICKWIALGLVYSPSTEWSKGGPLIDSYKVEILGPEETDNDWWAWIGRKGSPVEGGPTALIAVCRAVVAGKFGETVDVPEELA